VRRLEKRLRDDLHAARPPSAAEAERRAWEVVRAAHAERAEVGPRPRPVRRLALVALAASLAAVVALSPAGAQVGDWIGDVVSPAPDATPSTLGTLPADGRLLVVGPGGPWVVHDDGARRRLGDFRDATWSPGGRYVAAARGRQLVALQPDGEERWVRPAPGPVSAPRWAPDGYRIAYRSGGDLWVAVGDNTGAGRLARGVDPVPPAWQPGRPSPGQVLAFSSGRSIRIVEVDGPRPIGATHPGPPARELWWTADGGRLVAVSDAEIRVYGQRGRLLHRRALPPRTRATGSALDRAGRRLAVAVERRGGTASELLMYRLAPPAGRPPGRPDADAAPGRSAPPSGRSAPDAAPERLFAGSGRIEGLTWSMDGRVLVLGRPDSDQWLLLRPRARGRLQAVSRIRRRFAGGNRAAARLSAPFPRPAGWCYAEPQETEAPACSAGAAPAGSPGR
jgi:WD40-like Beta Propeller Repeat